MIEFRSALARLGLVLDGMSAMLYEAPIYPFNFDLK
jgi:hypothetical protein